jgi:hypothetical protein
MPDWDKIDRLAGLTGLPVLVGDTREMSRSDYWNATREANMRHLCLVMGDSRKDPAMRDTEIYALKKGGKRGRS